MTLRPSAARLAPIAGLALSAGLLSWLFISGRPMVRPFETAAIILGAQAAAAIVFAVRPAWPVSLGLALTVFSGHWANMGVPFALDRLMLAAGIISTLVRARVRSADALRSRPVDWLLATVALYAVVSAVLAGTISDHGARFALIDRFSLLGFVLFFVAPLAFREPRDRRVLLGTLVVLGGYLGLTALFETTGPKALVLPHYISDPSIGGNFDRARGPFVEAGANGLALYGCGVAAVLAACTWHDRRWRAVAAVVAGLCALGVLLTVTRAAWIASGAATVVALLATHQTRRLLVPAAMVAAVGVVVAFAAIPGLHGRASDRTSAQPPIWDRKNSNAAALRMIAQRPVLGFGWGRFVGDSPNYYRQSPDYPLTFVNNVHNVYLANAVELGLLGAGLWLFAVAVVAVGTVLRRGPPWIGPWKLAFIALATAYLLTAATVPLNFAESTLVLWTLAGVIWAARPAPSAAPRRPDEKAAQRRLTAVAG
jgi:putative inorganic carbon (hco3(-)) transporter